MGFSAYLADFRDLVRDQQGLFYQQPRATQYINEARRQVSLLTGCCRRLVKGVPAFGGASQPGLAVPMGAQPNSNPNSAFATINGQERYPYQGFANTFLKSQYSGLRGICDVVMVSASWGGAVLPALDWMPFEDFQAYARSNQIIVNSYPCVWTVYNDGEFGEVWLFPVPMDAQEMQWDCLCTVADIFSDEDFDAIPEPFRDGVKYYAAMRAYESSGRYAAGQLMKAQFEDMYLLRRGAVDRGKTPSFYPSKI